MNETELCLNLINNIDDSVLLSEGYVLSKQVALSEKVETMLSVMGDTVEMYMTEASIGTGVTSGYKPNILQRIWDFIRRVAHAVINKFSDVLTKMKIRNYESVEIPMSYDDFKHDIELLHTISGKLKDSIQDKIDYEESDKTDFSSDHSKQIAIIKKLIEETKQFRILKATDKQKSSINPDKFMKMRDKIRYNRQFWSDVHKHVTNMNKVVTSSNEFSESYKQYSQEMQKLFAELAKVTTKLFEGFKFDNINAPEKKSDKKVEKKEDKKDNGEAGRKNEKTDTPDVDKLIAEKKENAQKQKERIEKQFRDEYEKSYGKTDNTKSSQGIDMRKPKDFESYKKEHWTKYFKDELEKEGTTLPDFLTSGVNAEYE